MTIQFQSDQIRLIYIQRLTKKIKEQMSKEKLSLVTREK